MQIYKDPADLKTDKVVFKVLLIFPANLPAGGRKETHSSRPTKRNAPPCRGCLIRVFNPACRLGRFLAVSCFYMFWDSPRSIAPPDLPK